MANTHRAPTFWKTAIIYGGLSGLLVIGLMIGSYTIFGMDSNAASQAVGFLLMFLILSLIFFGMKRFRDHAQGGVIKFSKAFMLGFAISFFAGIAYVLVWEIYVNMTDNAFIEHYTAHLIDLEKAKGVTGQALADFTDKMAEMKTKYSNPFYRIPWTFTEIFPVGLIVSLVSALILHNPKIWARKV